MEQQTGSKLGEEYIKAVYCNPAYLTYIQSTSCEMPDWIKHKLESICWEKYRQPQICRWHHAFGRKQRGIKRASWWRWKRRVLSWLKSQDSKNKDHHIQPHHFIANKWGNSGNSDRLFFGAPKSLQMMTATMKLKDTCSLEERLLTNLDSILKSRGITLPAKVHLVSAMVFPVVMHGCESWITKKAEHRRIDAFELWC